MEKAKQHTVTPAAITVAGNTGALPNLSALGETPPVCTAIIAVTAIGGTPSDTFNLDVSADGGANWATVATTPAMTAVGNVQRLVALNIIEPLVRVSWPAPTGATPSLTVTVNILFN